MGSSLDAFTHQVVIGVGRDNHDPDVGKPADELGARVGSGHARQVGVKEDDVGLGLGHELWEMGRPMRRCRRFEAIAWVADHPDSDEEPLASWKRCVQETLDGAPMPELPPPWAW